MSSKNKTLKVVDIRPLADNIVVSPLEADTVTESGIYIPEKAKEPLYKGEVLATGPGRIKDNKRISMDVKVGDVVMYKKWAGTEYKFNGKELLIVKEEDLLAIEKK